MTRRARLWMTAIVTIAAAGVMAVLAITAQAGMNQTHTNPPVAGIAFNALD